MSRTMVALGSVALLAMACPARGEDWQPAKGPLMTRWAKDVSPDRVHPEYPRPQMVRENWTNLNGLWEYAIRPAAEEDAPEKYDGQILVPFPLESALSGVMKRLAPDQRLWYCRTVQTPELKDSQRLLLHFGAVDWQCEVFVNGECVGDHTGGYDPFSFDITDALDAAKAETEIVVVVHDPTDANWQPRGKQVNNPRGIWYTPTSGIWQTVWMEVVPQTSIESLNIVPNVDAGSVRIAVKYRGDKVPSATTVRVFDGEREVAGSTSVLRQEVEIAIPDPKLWTPDSPFLYGLQFEVVCEGQDADRVTSYFGMRKIALGKDKDGITRIMLNDEPLFQYGLLDQGFWPDGLYTAPTDEALKYDLEVTKKLGFNMVRKHVKVEPARWYYHCDKLGLLVWQDMPNGDRHARWDPVGTHDGTQIERSQESADNFRQEWTAIVNALRNHPSVVVWVPFNEAWGQFDTEGITKLTEQLDPTRLINSASGGNDFPVGHIYDLHRYPGPTIPELKDHRAVVLGEFGGLGLPLEGHTWQARDNWGYRSFTSREELQAAYEQLLFRLRPLVGRGLSAAVYTQTTDVEIEVNGLLTYDRAVLKLDAERIAAIHAKLHQPAPKEVVVVPTSRDEPQTWRYTLEKPADGWERPGFDDSGWKEAPGGFGEPSTPGSKVRTLWKTNDIWLRRTVELPKLPAGEWALAIHYDEDTEVYLNGVLAASVKGYTTDYTLVPVNPKAAAALKEGHNTIALHCRQTGGGQYIDVGLVRLEEASE